MSTVPPAGPEPTPVFPAQQPPVFGQPSYPPYYAVAPEPVRPRTLGAVSMGLALAVFVLSMIASAIVGASAGPYAHRTAASFDFNTSNLTPEQAQSFAPIALLMGAQILLGTALGIIALVLGIIAVATKRGRAFGVVGIVAAALAPILSFALYMGTLIATLPPA